MVICYEFIILKGYIIDDFYILNGFCVEVGLVSFCDVFVVEEYIKFWYDW